MPWRAIKWFPRSQAARRLPSACPVPAGKYPRQERNPTCSSRNRGPHRSPTRRRRCGQWIDSCEMLLGSASRNGSVFPNSPLCIGKINALFHRRRMYWKADGVSNTLTNDQKFTKFVPNQQWKHPLTTGHREWHNRPDEPSSAACTDHTAGRKKPCRLQEKAIHSLTMGLLIVIAELLMIYKFFHFLDSPKRINGN